MLRFAQRDSLKPAGFFSLKVLELSHPARPVTRLSPTCLCPEAVRVERSMPLECPQLLDSYSSDRPIQKQVIYKRIVPVDTEVHHF
jgi:hypothetical protein